MVRRGDVVRLFGVGALFKFEKRFVHPSKDVDRLFPGDERMEIPLVFVEEGKATIRRKESDVAFFHRHDGGEGTFHVNITHVSEKTLQWKGNLPAPQPAAAAAAQGGGGGGGGGEGGEGGATAAEADADIMELDSEEEEEEPRQRNEEMDSEDEPEQPQPQQPQQPQSRTYPFVEWEAEWTDITKDEREGSEDFPASLLNFKGPPTPLNFFLHFFPVKFLNDVIIPATNVMGASRQGWKQRHHVTLAEMLRWLGLWFLFGLHKFSDRRTFWAKPSSHRTPASPTIRVNHIMSRTRFESILKAFTLTARSVTESARDKFWEVRDFIDAFNANTRKNFKSCWMNTLDESMSKHTSPYVPAAVFIPRKFTQRGNEFHTIACHETKIIHHSELVEGKDRPAHLGQKRHTVEDGKTAGLIVRMAEDSGITEENRVVIMDSGFSVLRGIARLREVGVFSSAIIKKKKSWPKFVDGDKMDAVMKNERIGTTKGLRGKFHLRPNKSVKVMLFASKGPDYVTKQMASYGTTVTSTRKVKVKNIILQYGKILQDYYEGRADVDINNNRRQHDSPMEEVIRTHTWSHRIFTYFLRIAEINAGLAYFHFHLKGKGHKSPLSVDEFRQLLADELIHNADAPPVKEPTAPGGHAGFDVHHDLLSQEPGMRWIDGVWQKVSCNKTPARYCALRGEGPLSHPHRTAFYCRCDPSTAVCPRCFGQHVRNAFHAAAEAAARRAEEAEEEEQ